MLHFCLSFQWYQETIRHFFVSVCVSAAKRQDVTSLSPFSLIPRNNMTFLRFSVCQCSEEERCLSFFVCQSVLQRNKWGGICLFLRVRASMRLLLWRFSVSVCWHKGERERLFSCVGKGWERASVSVCWQGVRESVYSKLQTLVYDILPSTTAVFIYVTGSRKLSANEQFFVGAQTVVSLLQTTQIKQGVSFIATSKVYISTNKTTIVWIETELFLLPGVDASDVYVRALGG